jgi:hypothetical protein
MGMPVISVVDIDIDVVITNMIASIALVEAGISHILNAEGEKIQKAVGNVTDGADGTTLAELIQINNSVQGMVDSTAKLEEALQAKLDSVLSV